MKEKVDKLSVEYWRKELNDPSIDQVWFDGKDYHLVRDLDPYEKEKLERCRRDRYESENRRSLRKKCGLWSEKASEEELSEQELTVLINFNLDEDIKNPIRSARVFFSGSKPGEMSDRVDINCTGDDYYQEGGRIILANDLIIAALAVLECPSPYLVADKEMVRLIRAIRKMRTEMGKKPILEKV